MSKTHIHKDNHMQQMLLETSSEDENESAHVFLEQTSNFTNPCLIMSKIRTTLHSFLWE